MEKRGSFGSKFGVLAALAGSAVGLGNMWRFPYLMGTNGGAAFVFIYLFMVLVLCIPIMYTEFVIGRRSGKNSFGAFRVLNYGKGWSVIGVISVLCSIFILGFYTVVGGWIIDYIVKSAEICVGVDIAHGGEMGEIFAKTMTSNWSPILYMALFVALTAGIVMAGVEKGIEKFSKYMMPLLFVLVIVVAVRSLTLGGSERGLAFLFNPDFSKVTSNTVMDAMGQAFFSLSLGMGCILTYASYVSKKESIIKTSMLTSISDTAFALLSGLAIMPAVFAFGIAPSEGPGLVFVVLPEIFQQIPLGSILQLLFFFALFLAAITSSISLFEVSVSFVNEEIGLKRSVSTTIVLIVVVIFGALASLSLGSHNITVGGYTFFDALDKFTSNILMPLGGLLIVIFVGWVMPKRDLFDELTSGNTIKVRRWFLNYSYFVIKYLAPIIIATVMLRGLIDKF